MAVTRKLRDAYEEQYTDSMTEWRELGGRHKADNILKVCRDHRFATVLDCGAGEGSVLEFLAASRAFQELHAVEISDSGIAQIQKRKIPTLKTVKKFDGYRIPYPDDAFDMAYCSHVLEHVEHPRVLLRELKRVSKHQVFEIPLDYSPTVDVRVKDFLAYGHINVFTPALFKFLLKSEGYGILEELLTHTASDVLRYNMYENQKLPRTFLRELRLRLQPLKRLLGRLRRGRDAHRETAYSAFTCLGSAIGELKVFQGDSPDPGR